MHSDGVLIADHQVVRGTGAPRGCERRARGVAGRRFGALEQLVGRHMQDVGDELQLLSGKPAAPGLDAAQGRLVEADVLGEGALAPALRLAQERDARADHRVMLIWHRFRHLP